MTLVASLFGVLVTAKVLAVAGRDVPVSMWTPVAYFWQDALVALLFGISALVRRPAVTRVLYGGIVIYTAINVPIARTLSSPLTPTMIRATGGPLTDSIAHALTVANVSCILLVIGVAILLPWWLRRFDGTAYRAALVSALALIALGPAAGARVDTVGLHRNALVALLPSALPQADGAVLHADWRESPFASPAAEDLTRYRGAAKGRNVLMVVLESTAARYLKLYGAADDPTPNLTALGRRSIVFDAAYVTYPESIKGLFATLCSQYPAYDTPAEAYADVRCPSLADRLRAVGYHTALFHSGRFRYLGMPAVIEHRGFDRLADAGAIGGVIQSSFGVDESSTVQSMLAWIDSLEPGEPFFLTYLPVAGHHPYATAAPGPFDDSTDAGRYKNALREGDAALGELLAGLRARNLDDRTLIVVFGDHGEAFGQHDGNFGHAQFIYDENVRVPYLIASPTSPKSPQELHVRRVVSVIDTAPTILDLLGLADLKVRPATYQGVSLLQPASRMALFFTDYSVGWLGLRDGCWKYLYQVDAGRSKLFDVCTDPDETRDRAAGLDERVRAYRDRVLRWIAATRSAR